MAKKCGVCGIQIKNRLWVDGVLRNLQRRKYCLTCSPFGSGNKRKLELGGPVEKKDRDKLKYRKWQQKARRERKQKLVKMLGGKCSRCGYSRCLAALDLHHKDPSQKLFTFSTIGLIKRWSLLVMEAKKCELLCKNCHAEFHTGS